jgi:hypothetical protein
MSEHDAHAELVRVAAEREELRRRFLALEPAPERDFNPTPKNSFVGAFFKIVIVLATLVLIADIFIWRP